MKPSILKKNQRPIAIACAVLILSACGGGGGSTSPTSSATGTPPVTGTGTGTGTGSSTGPYGVDQCSTPAVWGNSQAHSVWAYPVNNQLAYKNLNSQGDAIMDFSSAGYMNGGVAWPTPPATVTVSPLGAGQDDSVNLQAAINQVSALPPDANGIRGVVLLSAGSFSVLNTLTIAASGVILRGSGSGPDGTVIHNLSPAQNGSSAAIPAPGSGNGQTLLQVQGPGGGIAISPIGANLTDTYLPSGSTTLTVDNAAVFHTGDAVVIQRPVTQAWVNFMQMANLGPGENWISVGHTINTLRRITAINGNRLTLDSPVSDSFDSAYLNPPGTKINLYSYRGQIQQVGIEHLRMTGTPRTSFTNNNMLVMGDVADAWVNDVSGDNFTSGLTIKGGTQRITVEKLALTHENNGSDVPCTGAKFAEISIGGSQILIDRSSSSGAAASFYYATEAEVTGPNVLLNFSGTPDSKCGSSSIQPHQRWATGLLVDGASLASNPLNPNSYSIDFINRGSDGSGHGWAIGWGVVWNSSGSFNVQAPPGAMNWIIGSSGPVLQQTTWQPGLTDSLNQAVAPKSLYLAQLCQKKGPAAITAAGY